METRRDGARMGRQGGEGGAEINRVFCFGVEAAGAAHHPWLERGRGQQGGGIHTVVRDGRFTHIRLQYEGVLVADLECLSPVSPPTRPYLL